MTAHQKQTIKSFVPYLAFLPVIYLLVSWGRFIESSESRMFKDAAQKEEIISHSTKGTDSYKNVHMELLDKDDRYIRKNELKGIKEDISEIKAANIIIQKDIKEILKTSK